ncbi:tetraspanin family [Schistosoma japonicum]|nr:tetraspanin family [Schistosoma japonicum]
MSGNKQQRASTPLRIIGSLLSLLVIMTDLIYDRMVKTFPNYGQNMQVTNAWDTIQNNLRCCAIHNRGWADYNKTVWYKLTNADIHQHGKLIPRALNKYESLL